MNLEEKVLLERTLKLSEENNLILQKMQRTARWAVLWGFIKVTIVVVPLMVGYFYLQPFIGQIMASFSGIKETLDLLK